MTQVKNISINKFSYHLPDDRIAKYPLSERDASKLLLYDKGDISEHKFKNIGDLLEKDSLIVFNNTKVIQARLNFRKESGAKIEIFCLEPYFPTDYEQSFQTRQKVQWKCIVGNAKKWKTGIIKSEFRISSSTFELKAEKIKQLPNAWIIEFTWTSDYSFSEIIEAGGQTPIPPYLNRKAEESDKIRYQTVYSKHKGSVAAPTAGLHFTENIVNNLSSRNIEIAELSLHVGAGTFKPVKSETIGEHEMHSEHFIVSKEVIQKLLQNKAKITAVGTTSVRTLESLYWIGVKINSGKFSDREIFNIQQWDAYELENKISTNTALNEILNYMLSRKTRYLEALTQIMIVPSYEFKLVNKLITNFHQPKSTLLLLISAFIGDDWAKVYQFALSKKFRFLSYGDSSLLIR